jgi:hypothetical protein
VEREAEMTRVRVPKIVPDWEDGIGDSNRFWSSFDESRQYARLEDIIRVASAGKRVSGIIVLGKKHIEIKVKGAEADRHRARIAAFLLLAEYEFSFAETTAHLSKVYAFGRAENGKRIPEVDLAVANQRLRADYERLRLANVKFKEAYFEDESF